eukprot:9466734-Pyramimonas_sp.AAC.1
MSVSESAQDHPDSSCTDLYGTVSRVVNRDRTFVPSARAGVYEHQGSKRYMEDTHAIYDDISEQMSAHGLESDERASAFAWATVTQFEFVRNWFPKLTLTSSGAKSPRSPGVWVRSCPPTRWSFQSIPFLGLMPNRVLTHH